MFDYSTIYSGILQSLTWSGAEEGGFILDTKTSLQFYPAQNTAKEADKFIPGAKDYMKAAKLGRIVALYHTHYSSDEFSPQDKIMAASHDIDILLVNKQNEFKVYRPAIDKYNCVDFIVDYYKRFNIKINLEKLDPEQIESIAKDNNFIKTNQLTPNSIIVLKTAKGIHLGICINQDYYLHYNKDGEFRSLIPKQFINSIYVPRTI